MSFLIESQHSYLKLIIKYKSREQEKKKLNLKIVKGFEQTPLQKVYGSG